VLLLAGERQVAVVDAIATIVRKLSLSELPELHPTDAPPVAQERRAPGVVIPGPFARADAPPSPET
jgi:hypothetical protein